MSYILQDVLEAKIDELEQENLIYFNLLDSRENEIVKLKKQLKEANSIITHVIFDSKDSQNIAYDYLAKHGLIKAGEK